MGDEKEHMTIQKKDTETASQEVVTQDFDTATESFDPPALQLKVDGKAEAQEEGAEKVQESGGAFQFALDGPPENPSDQGSKVIGGETIQGKGIAEPFKMPTIQKKEATPQGGNLSEKPSFTV